MPNNENERKPNARRKRRLSVNRLTGEKGRIAPTPPALPSRPDLEMRLGSGRNQRTPLKAFHRRGHRRVLIRRAASAAVRHRQHCRDSRPRGAGGGGRGRRRRWGHRVVLLEHDDPAIGREEQPGSSTKTSTPTRSCAAHTARINVLNTHSRARAHTHTRFGHARKMATRLQRPLDPCHVKAVERGRRRRRMRGFVTAAAPQRAAHRRAAAAARYGWHVVFAKRSCWSSTTRRSGNNSVCGISKWLL